MRESFVFYESYYNAIDVLPNAMQLELYKAIFRYAFNDELPKFKGIEAAIFALIKPQIDASNNRYQVSVNNGKKGGRPSKKAEKTATKTTEGTNIQSQEKPKIT